MSMPSGKPESKSTSAAKAAVQKLQDLSAKELNQRMIERRAIEAIIWGMPAVNFELMYQAMVTIVSAENRQESRGAQAREDFPKRDDKNWTKHTTAWCDEKGNAKLDYRPVHMNTLTNDVQSFPPKERVY